MSRLLPPVLSRSSGAPCGRLPLIPPPRATDTPLSPHNLPVPCPPSIRTQSPTSRKAVCRYRASAFPVLRGGGTRPLQVGGCRARRHPRTPTGLRPRRRGAPPPSRSPVTGAELRRRTGRACAGAEGGGERGGAAGQRARRDLARRFPLPLWRVKGEGRAEKVG